MRWPWLLLPAVLFLSAGCDLFQERTVQLDPSDPVLVALKAQLDAGALDPSAFELAVQKHVGVAVRNIQADLSATAPAMAATVKDAVTKTLKESPPTDKSPLGIAFWIAAVLVPGVAGAVGANRALKNKPVTISSTVATPTPRTAAGGA